jgi:hypothetical protein
MEIKEKGICAFSSEKLKGFALDLEYSLYEIRLASVLFTQAANKVVKTGRLRILAKHVEGHEPLREAIKSNESALEIESAWRASLKGKSIDLDIIHAIAVLYRESAFMPNLKEDDRERYCQWSVALWTVLLATPVFMETFSKHRYIEGDMRIDLTTEQCNELHNHVLDRIFSSYAEYGIRALSAGRLEEAKMYAGCLHIAIHGRETLEKTISQIGMSMPSGLDSERLSRISVFVNCIFDRWARQVLDEAQCKYKDLKAEPDSEKIPVVLNILQPFIDMDFPVVRVLGQAMEWYIEWFFALYHQTKTDVIKTMFHTVEILTTQLKPLMTKGMSQDPVNQALSKYFMFKGALNMDDYKAIDLYNESLEWNPHNDNARRLLQDRKDGMERM